MHMAVLIPQLCLASKSLLDFYQTIKIIMYNFCYSINPLYGQ